MKRVYPKQNFVEKFGYGRLRIKMTQLIQKRTGWYVLPERVIPTLIAFTFHKERVSWNMTAKALNKQRRGFKIHIFSADSLSKCCKGFLLLRQNDRLYRVMSIVHTTVQCTHSESFVPGICGICGAKVQPVQTPEDGHNSAGHNWKNPIDASDV